MSTRTHAFSLVELLVVVSVITLLIGILLPVLSKARNSANSLLCLSQLRQITLAVHHYADAHDGLLPRSSHSAMPSRVRPWGQALMPFLGHGDYAAQNAGWFHLFNSLYRCPSDPRTSQWSYGKNVWFELTAEEAGDAVGKPSGPTFEKISRCRCGCSTVLFAEIRTSAHADHVMAHFWLQGGATEVDTRRHGNTANYAFLDGHAESMTFQSTFDLSRSVDLWNPGRDR